MDSVPYSGSSARISASFHLYPSFRSLISESERSQLPVIKIVDDREARGLVIDHIDLLFISQSLPFQEGQPSS